MEAALYEKYEPFSGDPSELSPVKIMYINGEVLRPQDNVITREIHSLRLSHTFIDIKSLMQWLIPTSNRHALQRYYANYTKAFKNYEPLFAKLNERACPCLQAYVISKNSYNNSYADCIQSFLQDSALMAEYLPAFYALDDEKKNDFFLAALSYSKTRCDTLFHSLIDLSVIQCPKDYRRDLEFYHSLFVEKAAHYNNENKDSLKIVFPQFALYRQDLNVISKLFQQPDNYFDRGFSLIGITAETTIYNICYYNRQYHITAMVTVEIYTHGPSYYITKLLVKPRQKIPNVSELDDKVRKHIEEQEKM
ncbi:hypothetical protein QEG73_05395 [Chitinophagaceae bacterium 26-R-25]|nr:hypothetical protein [Chitinophagaceae bacterium 26-R-25]